MQSDIDMSQLLVEIFITSLLSLTWSEFMLLILYKLF